MLLVKNATLQQYWNIKIVISLQDYIANNFLQKSDSSNNLKLAVLLSKQRHSSGGIVTQ